MRVEVNRGIGVSAKSWRPSEADNVVRESSDNNFAGAPSESVVKVSKANVARPSAHRYLRFACGQVRRLMNRPSQRRKVNSAPVPCGSRVAFTSGVTCASIARSKARIVSSCRVTQL